MLLFMCYKVIQIFPHMCPRYLLYSRFILLPGFLNKQKNNNNNNKLICICFIRYQLVSQFVVITDSIVEPLDSGLLKRSTWYFCWFVLCCVNYWISKDFIFTTNQQKLNNCEKTEQLYFLEFHFKCNIFLLISLVIPHLQPTLLKHEVCWVPAAGSSAECLYS